MAQTPQQKAKSPPPVVDPDAVPETLCDGRFYIHAHGNLATLTFTHERPVPSALETGEVKMEGVVRARITMALSNFAALRNLLNETIKDGGSEIPTGGASSSTKH
jgi:hypothetical protein